MSKKAPHFDEIRQRLCLFKETESELSRICVIIIKMIPLCKVCVALYKKTNACAYIQFCRPKQDPILHSNCCTAAIFVSTPLKSLLPLQDYYICFECLYDENMFSKKNVNHLYIF